MFLGPADQEFVLLWSINFQAPEEHPCKLRQDSEENEANLENLQELSSLFQTCRCCLALEDAGSVAVGCGDVKQTGLVGLLGKM